MAFLDIYGGVNLACLVRVRWVNFTLEREPGVPGQSEVGQPSSLEGGGAF